MTCEDFRTLLAKDPDGCTKAELVAVVKHSLECDPCSEHMDAKFSEAEEFFATLGPEVERQVDTLAERSAEANYRRVVDSDDPELPELEDL